MLADSLRWVGLASAVPALWACTSRTLEPPIITPTATLTTNFTQKINNEIDILFMIDNSSSMTEMQQKLYAQLPTFMQVLESLPTPPEPPRRGRLVGHGRAGRLDQLDRLHGQGDQGAVPVHAARHLHGHDAHERAPPSSPTRT